MYGDKFTTMENGEEVLDHIQEMMETPFTELSEEHKEMLDKIGVNAWDLIQANSGGHKCITNISGLNYLGRSKRPPQGKYKYDSEKDDSPSVKFTKMIATEFERKLKEKIEESNEEIKAQAKRDIVHTVRPNETLFSISRIYGVPVSDIKKLNNLSLETVNPKKYPLIKVLSKLPNSDSLFETVLVATNDEFIKLYLSNKIKFNELSKKIYKFLNSNEFVKYKFIKPEKIETIEQLNKYVRFKINKLSV